MKFELHIECSAKKNTKEILDKIIQRASDAVLKEKSVKTVDIKGKIVKEDDSE